MKRNIITVFLAAAAALLSCTEGPDMPLQSLSLDKDIIVAPSMGAEYSLRISSNTSWKMEYSAVEWVVPSVEEFVGTSNIVLTVAENSSEERTGVVYVESKDGKVSRELKIVQSGAKSDGFISISSLRQMEKDGEEVVIDAASTRIKGFVVTDAVKGNWFNGSFAIEDSFSQPSSGMTVMVTGDYEAFSMGEEVSVELDKAVLKRSEAGLLTLTPVSRPYKTESTQIEMKPVKVDFDGLSDGAYESMFVETEGFQVVEESIGGVLAMSPYFENKDGQRFRLSVFENASFSGDSYPEGVGNVCGIAGCAAAEPDLYPTSGSDLALSEMRIGVLPGIRSLPYVFSFYHSEQTNGKTKYVSCAKPSWNAATQLLKGVVATDIEQSKGVFLEVTAYGSEASKIYGPNVWAEAGAHDNVNTSGFVSQDCKTTPTAECGFWLTVPLQMEMPRDFNVSFGLAANNKYVLSRWMVSWSEDKSTWHDAGEIHIDRCKTGGSYYLYFTVPVHVDIPLSAGTNLYLKFTPQGSDGTDGYTGADGHGSSCYVCLHSAIVLSTETEGSTSVPAGAVYFEPFDKLTAGMDYFIGEKLGGLANYCADEISSWTEGQKRGMSGTRVMERPGYAQIGYVETERASSRTNYVNEPGELLTPSLGKAGNFTLSFKACTYRTPAIRPNAAMTTPDVGSPDITSVVVEVVGGGSIGGKASVTVSGLPTDSFQTFSLKIDGATAATQIRFTSAPASGQFSRWFIDDILVVE